MNHSTRGCTDQCYVQGAELCRKPSFLFTSSLRRSLDWLESVVCLGECEEGPGSSEQFLPSWQHLQNHRQCWNPRQAMAGEAVPDVVSDLTLYAATYSAVQICFLGLAESRESLFCTMRHSRRIITKG